MTPGNGFPVPVAAGLAGHRQQHVEAFVDAIQALVHRGEVVAHRLEPVTYCREMPVHALEPSFDAGEELLANGIEVMLRGEILPAVGGM